MKKIFALLVGGILAGILANNASGTKPVTGTTQVKQIVDEMPLPSIRGMYCVGDCAGAAPDHHLGELAVLVMFRTQCFDEGLQGQQQGSDLVDYRFSVAWDEWNSTSSDAKNAAWQHEVAAVNARREKYGEQYGGEEWFCTLVSQSINKGHYRDLEAR
jgi:hypothetical protein